jgi:hypothetical protein
LGISGGQDTYEAYARGRGPEQVTKLLQSTIAYAYAYGDPGKS